MNTVYSSVISSTGSYLPKRIVENHELIQFPASRLQLIAEKTGVLARRFAADDECTSDLAIMAAIDCIEKSTIPVSEIDAIILATSSPDRIHPATATIVQNKIGALKAFAFDINSVCSGNVYALVLGDSLIRSGVCNNVLVIAAEVYSRFLNPNDFSTFPYFGDGAGAVLLTRGDDSDSRFIHSILRTDGSGEQVIQIPAGGSKKPSWRVENKNDLFFHMKGKDVFEFAIEKGSEIITQCLDRTSYIPADIKCIIAHQANINIIKNISKNTSIELDRFYINLHKYGNTAAASVFIALDEAITEKKFDRGDKIILVSFGGGLSWGTIMIQY